MYIQGLTSNVALDFPVFMYMFVHNCMISEFNVPQTEMSYRDSDWGINNNSYLKDQWNQVLKCDP